MKITIAQLNPVVGDISGNIERMKETLSSCDSDSPDLVVFPELYITGYPPRDLLERGWFLERVTDGIDKVLELSKRWPNAGILFGVPTTSLTDKSGCLYNSALLVQNGELLFTQHKSLLPSYDVFDEERYFDPAPAVDVFAFRGEMLGISICEDAWSDPVLCPRSNYTFDPMAALGGKGATIFINISASPFHAGKESVRFNIFKNHAIMYKIPFLYVNQIGGNDELIFDGRSACIDAGGNPVAVLPAFEECMRTIETKSCSPDFVYRPMEETESIYRALVLGLRDYVRKCGFSKVMLGLSGGIDSAVACCIASEALGPDNVLGVTMPGPYSSSGSIDDSRRLAVNLGVEFLEIPISSVYRSYLDSLEGSLPSYDRVTVTMENVQARIRGNMLMALSNEYGHMVLSTGNKSENAVGYCTLYGDMSGGLSVISDVPKTIVYRLASYINRGPVIIPESIIKKPPSAELRPEQKDQDTLPPYEVLDSILNAFVDEGRPPDEIIGQGHDPDIVEWVVRRVISNEYKRRQAAPGLKVTPRAFGSGRRMPIAAKYDLFR